MNVESASAKSTAQILESAQQLGFELVGIQPITPSQTIDVYSEWLQQGYAAKMGYLHRHLEKKANPANLLPQAKTIISLAINYHTQEIPKHQKNNPALGQISCYAWGDDYHQVIQAKLQQLYQKIRTIIQEQFAYRAYVDTGPILEREYAHRAGLGWFGKHSNLIHWKLGSWLFLSEILLDVPLAIHQLPMKGDCGKCTLCIDACPTEAIFADKQVDSQRCLSYLTIELKESIPKELRSQIGNWIFGCDICQEVCPWNRRAPISLETGFQARTQNITPPLIELMTLTQEQFSQRFRNSPIKRTKRRGFLRNVAIALGNWKSPLALSALKQAIYDHEPLVREHVAWAIGQIQTQESQEILKQAILVEEDQTVKKEMEFALKQLQMENTLAN